MGTCASQQQQSRHGQQQEPKRHPPPLRRVLAADSTPKLAVALRCLNGELGYDGKGILDLDIQLARDTILSKLGLVRGKRASQYFAECLKKLMFSNRSLMQTSQVRDALVQLLKQVISSIASIAEVLHELTNDKAGAKLCSTQEVHDAVCDSFTKSESKNEHFSLAAFVSNIINSNNDPSSFDLFASNEIIKSLISALSRQDPDCCGVPKAITAIITRHPPARPRFATEEVRDGFLNVMTHCSIDFMDVVSATMAISDAISVILEKHNNHVATQIFCTPEFAASFYFMRVRLESLRKVVSSTAKKKQETFLRTLELLDPDYEAHIPLWKQERLQLVVGATTTEQLGRALKLLYRNRDDILLTEQVCDLLLSKIHLVHDRETSKWFGKLLMWFANRSSVNDIKALVRTSQVRDAVVEILNRSSNKNIDVASVTNAMYWIVFDSNESVQRYSTNEFRDAVCVAFENATTNEEFSKLVELVHTLIDKNPSVVAELYATARFRDCVVRALRRGCVAAFHLVSKLIEGHPRPSQVHELFSTSEVCEGFVQVMKTIEFDFGIKYFSNAIFNIINNNEKGQQVFTDNHLFVEEFMKLEEWIDMEQEKTDKDGFLTSKGSLIRTTKLIEVLLHHWLYRLARKYSVTVPQQVIDILDRKEIDQTSFLLLTEFRLAKLDIPEGACSTLVNIIKKETAPPSTISPAALQLLDRLRQEFPLQLVYEPHRVEFDTSSHLGQGSYGSVRAGSILLPRNKKKRCAAKFCKHIEIGIKEAKNYIGLDHSNVTQLLGVTVSSNPTDPDFIILLELAERDFSKLLLSSSPPLSLPQIRRYALQIASGLGYLHAADENRGKKRILHLDLKPSNAIVFPGDVLKLVDFGSMKETDHTMTETTHVAGTTSYLPPETLISIRNGTPIEISPSIDVFALGVILLQMLTHSSDATRVVSSERIATRVLSGSTIECCVGDIMCHSPEISEGGKDLIEICKRCLLVDPNARPTNGGELLRLLNPLGTVRDSQAADDGETRVNSQAADDGESTEIFVVEANSRAS